MSKKLFTAEESVVVGLLAILLVLAVICAAYALSGLLIMLVWNCLIAAPLGLVKIPFIAGVGISILISLVVPRPQSKSV